MLFLADSGPYARLSVEFSELMSSHRNIIYRLMSSPREDILLCCRVHEMRIEWKFFLFLLFLIKFMDGHSYDEIQYGFYHKILCHRIYQFRNISKCFVSTSNWLLNFEYFELWKLLHSKCNKYRKYLIK